MLLLLAQFGAVACCAAKKLSNAIKALIFHPFAAVLPGS